MSRNLPIVFLMAAVVGLGCADATDESPAFRITMKRQENGYFEMTLPKAFFDGNPHTIQVNWIDFYR